MDWHINFCGVNTPHKDWFSCPGPVTDGFFQLALLLGRQLADPIYDFDHERSVMVVYRFTEASRVPKLTMAGFKLHRITHGMCGAGTGIAGHVGSSRCIILDASNHVDKRAFPNTRLANEKDVDFDFRLEAATTFYEVLGQRDHQLTSAIATAVCGIFWILLRANAFWCARRGKGYVGSTNLVHQLHENEALRSVVHEADLYQ